MHKLILSFGEIHLTLSSCFSLFSLTSPYGKICPNKSFGKQCLHYTNTKYTNINPIQFACTFISIGGICWLKICCWKTCYVTVADLQFLSVFLIKLKNEKHVLGKKILLQFQIFTMSWAFLLMLFFVSNFFMLLEIKCVIDTFSLHVIIGFNVQEELRPSSKGCIFWKLQRSNPRQSKLFSYLRKWEISCKDSGSSPS